LLNKPDPSAMLSDINAASVPTNIKGFLAETHKDVELLLALNSKEDHATFEAGELAVLVADRCDRARDQLRKIVVQLAKEKNLQKEVDLVNSIQSKILKALNIEMEVNDENASHKENPDKIVQLDSKEEAEILDIEHQLTAMLDSFVPVRRFFVKEYYIPKIKRINASEACKLPKEERIAGLVDLTANGSCKNCIVLILKLSIIVTTTVISIIAVIIRAESYVFAYIQGRICYSNLLYLFLNKSWGSSNTNRICIYWTGI